ncbi:hypothetical protein SKPI104516_14035 [Skermania piniformis]
MRLIQVPPGLLVSSGLLVALTVAVNLGGPVALVDHAGAVLTVEHSSWRKVRVAQIVSSVGDPHHLIPLTFVAALGVAVLRRSGLRGALIVATVGIACAISLIMKDLLPSPRPDIGFTNVLHAYPSTHTTATATLFGAIAVTAFARRKVQDLALVLAALGGLAVGLARVVVQAHWPSDIVGGLLLGGVAVFALRWFCDTTGRPISPADPRTGTRSRSAPRRPLPVAAGRPDGSSRRWSWVTRRTRPDAPSGTGQGGRGHTP